MALATKPKPKTYYKKRQAQHHRHGKQYVKAYLPYLPMLAVVGVGVLVSKNWAVNPTAVNFNPRFGATRLGALTGNSSNALLYVALAVVFVAFAVLVLSHWYRVHRLLNRGELFMVKHPWFDIGLVVVTTAGVVLIRA